jgi:putative ABC transport system permease protein
MAGGRWRISWGENVAFAFVAMREQKLRSFLTLLGIMAGVATVIMMVSFVVGFNNQVVASFTQFGTYLVQFQKYEPRFGGRTAARGPAQPARPHHRGRAGAEAPLEARGRGLAGALPLRRQRAGARRAARKRTAGGARHNPDYTTANTHYVDDGRFITDADLTHAARVAVVGLDVANALYPQRDAVLQEMTINGVAYRVIGIFEHKGGMFGSNNNFVAIPITTFDEQFPEVKNGHGDTIHIATVPRRAEDVQALIEEETAILRRPPRPAPEPAQRLRALHQPGPARAVPADHGRRGRGHADHRGIALLVGGVGVMNIMLVNVTQRTREIGVRKALGATRRDIATQFLVEAVTLTAWAGAWGIGVGLGAALLARVVFDFEAAAPLWAVLLGFGVSTAVGVAFGLWPAVKASRLDPIEALRYE